MIKTLLLIFINIIISGISGITIGIITFYLLYHINLPFSSWDAVGFAYLLLIFLLVITYTITATFLGIILVKQQRFQHLFFVFFIPIVFLFLIFNLFLLIVRYQLLPL